MQAFQLCEKVKYLVGSPTDKVATISSIESHVLSNKSFVFKLVFDDESLAPHLKEQPVTVPQNLECFEKVAEVDF